MKERKRKGNKIQNSLSVAEIVQQLLNIINLSSIISELQLLSLMEEKQA